MSQTAHDNALDRILLPERYPPDLLTLDISALPVKDSRLTIEFPFFQLTKTPSDPEERVYKDHRGNTLRISPHHKLGYVTQYDKHLLIYLISLAMRHLNSKPDTPLPQRMRFYAGDFIRFANRTNTGHQYQRLDDSLRRLTGCQFEIDVTSGNRHIHDNVHLLDASRMVREYDTHGRLLYIEIALSDWIRTLLEAKMVLTLHPHYFRLSSPLEQRLYEIARKFCGRQQRWAVNSRMLQIYSGSAAVHYSFLQQLRKIAASGDLLDYRMRIDNSNNRRQIVIFERLQGTLIPVHSPIVTAESNYTPSPALVSKIREEFGAKIDIDKSVKDFNEWVTKKKIRPTNGDALFLSFIKSWLKNPTKPPEVENGQVKSWSDKLKMFWWKLLTDERKSHLRGVVGTSVVLDDGQGWVKNEESVAVSAFDRVNNPNRPPDAFSDELKEAILYAHNLPATTSFEEAFAGWRDKFEDHYLIANQWLYYLVKVWKPLV